MELSSAVKEETMRLILRQGQVSVQLTLAWEAADHLEQGERWIPFCLVGQTISIGEIHATSHSIRLYPGHEVVDRQLVVFSPPT